VRSWGCLRVDRELRRGETIGPAATAHAERCLRCAERIRAFRQIEAAAPGLARAWDSPDLLPRILRAIDEAAAAPRPESPAPARTPLSPWVAAAYGAALVVLSTLGLWVFRDSPNRTPFSGATAESPFLNEDALRDVERKESAYVASIDRLASLVRARGPAPPSGLAESYQEKLMLIDSAIAECRAQIDQNRYNAHLRQQLLAMYGEKKRTLEDLLKEVKS
jgi:hypothetical protein